MLHLRVISPATRTEAVRQLLTSAAGVTHLTIDAGAACEPPGDLVQADIVRESADPVLDGLERLGIRHGGAITLQPVQTVFSDSADRAARQATGDEDDAVVWQQLLAETHEESTLGVGFVTYLTIACLLSAIGVATNSPVTIVGAMVVGPEFGPLAALAVGLVTRDFRLARRSVTALLVAFPIALAVTLVSVTAWEMFGWVTVEQVRDADRVDFIYQVGPFSLIVALLAGTAGMLSLVTAKSAALIGVFISVTTVPAAGYAVVAATLGEWRVAAGSLGQLAVNLVGIVVAGVVLLGVYRCRPAHPQRHRLAVKRPFIPVRRDRR